MATTFDKPLEKGRYKTTPNSPTRPDGSVHEYCPPEQVASEMDELIRMHAGHETGGVPAEVEAAWIHHRFAQIHPFADGNGRVARAIASLIFIKAGWFPLIVKRDDWARYIEELEKADAGDLRPLVAMFVEGQRTALIQAIEVAYDVRPITSVDGAIVAARDQLLRHRGTERETAATQTAFHLQQYAIRRLREVSERLREEAGERFGFETSVKHHVGSAAWVQLLFKADPEAILDLFIRYIGPRSSGIISLASHLVPQGGEPITIDGTFLISYAEELTHAQTRFSAWLERVIVEGLNEWRRTL